MIKKEIGFKYKGKEISLDVLECGFFERFRGLMFRKKEEANALLFDFKKSVNIPIHSFFVYFPFVAIWLDNDDKIVDLKIVKSPKLLIKSKIYYINYF